MLIRHALGTLQVKAIEKAAQPAQANAAVGSDDAKAGDGVTASGNTAAADAPLANGTAAVTAMADGPTGEGSAKAAPKRKRAEAATTVSEPANGAATPSEQECADKPRKKSKAKAAGNDAATAEIAADTNGVVSPSTAEVAGKRKKVSEPTADAVVELTARVGGQQSGKKARRKSEGEAQPADAAAGTAPQQQDKALPSAAAEHGSSQSVEQREAALERMTATGLSTPNAELRKIRKEKKAAQACAPDL